MTFPAGAFAPVPSGAALILEDTIMLERSAADVWAFVRDMENYPLWFPAIVAMESADDLPVATPGKEYREVALMPGGREEEIVVTVVEADETAHHLAIRASLAPFEPRFDYRVIEAGPGRATFHWRCIATGQSFKAKWQRPVMRMILRKRLKVALDNLRRILAGRDDEVMRAAQFWRFGTAHDVIRLFDRAARPRPKKGEVLVRQHASSVNPIDCHRRSGYGRAVMRIRGALNFPVTLGNDIAGTVAALGAGVSDWRVGDAVIGVKPPSSNGAFADYVTVKARNLIAKPAAMNCETAAALPYTFFTAWSALSKDGRLGREKAPGKRVFVQGGAGGVGSMAVQIAKYLGAEVSTSCSASDIERVRAMGADRVFDYRKDSYADELRDFDIALCTADTGEEDHMLGILKPGGRYVTVVHPTLALTDEHGLLRGLLAAKMQRRAKARSAPAHGKSIGWSLFKVDASAVTLFGDMVAGGHLTPLIDNIYPFDQIAAVQERMEAGLARGKVVMRIA